MTSDLAGGALVTPPECGDRKESAGFDGERLRRHAVLTTNDIQAAYKELSGRGVEFIEKPQQRLYGIDSSFRDPSGNSIRLTHPTAA